jgi:hypothetical protein
MQVINIPNCCSYVVLTVNFMGAGQCIETAMMMVPHTVKVVRIFMRIRRPSHYTAKEQNAIF